MTATPGLSVTAARPPSFPLFRAGQGISALGVRSMLLIYATTALGGMLGNLFAVAYVAALPEIVARTNS